MFHLTLTIEDAPASSLPTMEAKGASARSRVSAEMANLESNSQISVLEASVLFAIVQGHEPISLNSIMPVIAYVFGGGGVDDPDELKFRSSYTEAAPRPKQ